MSKITTLLACAIVCLLAPFTSTVQGQIFSENFNVGMPATFTLHNLDGLTPATNVAYVNNAWIVREDFVTTSDSCAFSTSWYTPAGTSNDWMVTPGIAIPATGTYVLDWEALAPDPAYPDGYQVRIATSPSSTAIQAGTQVFTIAAEANAWTPHQVVIPSSFLGQTIYIGFNNNSFDKFILMVDDITVGQQILYDAKIDFVNRLSEYYQIPLNQVTPINFGGDITNLGANAITNVALNVDVTNALGGTVYSASSTTTGSVASGGTVSKTIPSWTPTVPDTYTFTFYTSITEVDGRTTNDTVSQTLVISDSTFARDNNVLAGTIGIGAGTPGVLGQIFELNQADNLNSITFAIGNVNGNMTGQPVHAEVYSFNGLPNTLIASTDTIIMDTSSNVLITLPISGGPLALPADTFFIGIVEGDSNVTIGLSDNIFTVNTTYLNFPGSPFGTWSTNESFAVNQTYILRANLSQACVPFTFANTANDASCGNNDGSGTVITTGGAVGSSTYLWSNGATTQTATMLGAGTYAITVTDSLGCMDTTTIVINNIGGPVLDSLNSTNALCNGGMTGSANVVVSGGTPPYTYSWSNGATTQSISGLMAGSYNVTVTDANGCVLNAGATTVSQPAAITTIMSALDESAPGASDGQVLVQVSGGTPPYTYLWSNGATTASVPNLPGGTYVVNITDANGCTFQDSAVVGTMVSTGAVLNQDVAVNIFPNPSNGVFNLTVEMPKTGTIQVDILDMMGKIAYSHTESANVMNREINLRDVLPAGSYLLRVNAAGMTKIRKLVIE